jgi:hypothetical protein
MGICMRVRILLNNAGGPIQQLCQTEYGSSIVVQTL